MGREKRTQPGPATAKDRHKRAGKISKAIDRSEPLPPGLVAAKPMNAITKSKHQSYFEFIENKDKKKPLLFEITPNRNPPPAMKYIPIGNPELTERCKEISREEGASVYIVTFAKKEASELSQQIHRVGHHIREYIVEQAMRELGQETFYEPVTTGPNEVEEIPRSQVEINRQADAALRELFPRIPNTDRQQIIDHAFKKGKQFNGELVVGLQQELSLSRRVQLAVLAHIRHNHTRYDELLRETSWHNARRATEQLCLDILVKWRGDDENGRNQLDEILREVVVLSDDSDEEDSGEEPDSDSSAVLTDRSVNAARRASAPAVRHDPPNGTRLSIAVPSRPGSPRALPTPGKQKRISKKQRKRAKHHERNFSRYEAARNDAWTRAMRRQFEARDGHLNQSGMVDASASHGTYSQNQPVVFMEGRAPMLDLGPSQPQRLALGSYVSDNLHEPRSREDRSFAASGRSHQFPSGSSMHKVNESSIVGGPATFGPKGSQQSQNHQLKDYLHPSIEPRSPDVLGPPPSYTRPWVEYADLREDQPRHRLLSQPRGPGLREEGLPRQASQGYPTRAGPFLDGHEPSRPPATSYHNVSQVTARPPAYEVPRPSDPYMHRNESMLGERSNPIMIEEQHIHPQTVILGPGESVRDRFGPDIEILSVRRPTGDLGPGPQRLVPRDEGFIRLRESWPLEQRDGLQEEGFLRIREHPDGMSRQSMPVCSGRPVFHGLRSTMDSSRYQPTDAPEQAIYVRRAERMHPADLSYLDRGGHTGRANERIIRDVPSPIFGGEHVDQHPYHQIRGVYEVPVHRHARPAVSIENPRFSRYPAPPPGQPQWRRMNDDVIVLE